MFVETHVEQEAEVATFMQSAVDHFGQLNILVNNAGIRMYQTVVEASAESWNTILGVNLLGYVFGAKAAIPAEWWVVDASVMLRIPRSGGAHATVVMIGERVVDWIASSEPRLPALWHI